MEAIVGTLIVLFLIFGLPILICVSLGRTRDRTGWLWGLLLGWLGVLILACMKPIPLHVRIANQEADRQAEEQLWQARAAELAGREKKYPAWWR